MLISIRHWLVFNAWYELKSDVIRQKAKKKKKKKKKKSKKFAGKFNKKWVFKFFMCFIQQIKCQKCIF